MVTRNENLAQQEGERMGIQTLKSKPAVSIHLVDDLGGGQPRRSGRGIWIGLLVAVALLAGGYLGASFYSGYVVRGRVDHALQELKKLDIQIKHSAWSSGIFNTKTSFDLKADDGPEILTVKMNFQHFPLWQPKVGVTLVRMMGSGALTPALAKQVEASFKKAPEFTIKGHTSAQLVTDVSVKISSLESKNGDGLNLAVRQGLGLNLQVDMSGLMRLVDIMVPEIQVKNLTALASVSLAKARMRMSVGTEKSAGKVSWDLTFKDAIAKPQDVKAPILRIDQATIKFALESLTAQVINALRFGGMAKAPSTLADLISARAVYGMNIDLPEGKVKLTGSAKLNGAPKTMAMDDFSAALQVSAHIDFPRKAILKYAGDEMGKFDSLVKAEYLTLADGQYKTDFRLSDGKPLLNGKSLDLSDMATSQAKANGAASAKQAVKSKKKPK